MIKYDLKTTGRLVACVGGVAVLVVALGVYFPQRMGESARVVARRELDKLAFFEKPDNGEMRRILQAARSELAESLSYDDRNPQAWADQAYMLSLWSHIATERTNELGKEAEIAARRALAISELSYEYWVRLGVALDMQDRWSEANGAFAQALMRAPANPSAWYYYAYHLSLVPSASALAKAAIETCLRLDPSHRAARILLESLSSPPPS